MHITHNSFKYDFLYVALNETDIATTFQL